MSTTDELLKEMLEDVEEYATPVTDDDLQFWIDEHLRVISIPKNGVVAGVEGDKNVNKIKFGMNRYYHGFDMSTFSGRILYSNAKGNKNYYNITDMQASGSAITFSWLVDADAVQYMGKTAFVVYLFKTQGSELRQKFYSTLATLKVLEGMEVDSAVPVEKQTDIIERMKEEISAYAEEVKKSLPADYTAMTEQVSSLKEELENLKKIVEALQESMGQIYGNIVVSETTISMDEGTSVTFTVSLDKAPSENQTVEITTKGSYVTVSPSTLTFTPDNYNVAQRVTVSSTEDEDEGDKQETIALTSAYKTVQISITIVNNDVSIEWHTIVSDEVTGINSTNYLLATYTGSSDNVLIPATLNDKTVQMNVQKNASFDTNQVIKNMKFENGVVGAFNQNGSYLPLAERILDIPNLQTFGFNGSDTLKIVTIQENNTNCKSFNVSANTALEEISGLENLLSIEAMEQSMRGCTALVSLDKLPPKLKNSKLMCWNCTALKNAPVIDIPLITWTNMFLGCTELSEVEITAMTGCGVDLIGYNEESGTGWTGGNFTFKCNYNSDMYNSFRNMICDSKGSSEILFLETLDSTNNPITNIIMWGDSMTRAGNKTMGNMPEQLAELVTNDVMIWNYGCSGNTIQTAGTRFDNHSEKYGDVSVIWLGTNNTSLSGEEMTALIQSIFIDKLTTDKYIVVGLLTTNYSDEKNQAFADAFGDHFLNIREYFIENMWTVSGLTATEQDGTDLSNDLIPTSFRYDTTHLNPDGGKVVATGIKEKLLSMGYITSEQIVS